MNSQLTDLLLFAQRNAFRDMGAGFRDKREHFDPTDLIFWVGALVGVFVTLAILAKVIARREQRQVYNSPRALFRALCKLHDLDRHERAVLRKMAQRFGLEQPAQLFVEPELFDAACRDATLGQQLERVQSLRARLFAEAAGEAAAANESEAASEMQAAIDSVHSAAEAAADSALASDLQEEPVDIAAIVSKQPTMVMVPQMPSSFALDGQPTS